MEGFKRKIADKVEDIKLDVEIELEQKKEWVNRLTGQPPEEANLEKREGKKWTSHPMIIDSNEMCQTNLPLYLSELKNSKAFRSTFSKIKDKTEVGEITILSFGNAEEGFHEYGRMGSIQKAGIELFKDVKKSLHELALAIEHNDPTVEGTEYFYGVSRLATIADKFGFQTFDLDDIASKHTISHKWAKLQYTNAGVEGDKQDIVDKRPAKLAVISREELVARYGMKKAA